MIKKPLIKLISAPDTFPLRQQMRPLRRESEQGNPEDLHPRSFHVGCFLENELIGIASFNPESHEDFVAQTPYRLRGMATHFDYQGQGIGRATLRFGFSELARRQSDFLWCNARVGAFSFYEKMGLSLHGPLFDIPPIGAHKVMYKRWSLGLV